MFSIDAPDITELDNPIVLFSTDAPDIIELDNPIVVQFNRSAEIPCGAETVAHPFPSFQWFRRGQKGISLPNRFSILPQSGVLTVNDAQYEDAGIYICIASNFVGESSVLVNLLVLGTQYIN